MVRRNHRSIYDELDELKASMDYLFQLALDPADNLLLEERPEIICQYPHNLNAEVVAHDDEVAITVDMIPGMSAGVISADLVDPVTLKISCKRQEDTSKGHLCDPQSQVRSFSLHYLIPLPDPVTRNGARITLKNGVLDLHLKKKIS